jgi:hypothetical protein
MVVVEIAVAVATAVVEIAVAVDTVAAVVVIVETAAAVVDTTDTKPFNQQIFNPFRYFRNGFFLFSTVHSTTPIQSTLAYLMAVTVEDLV